MTESVFIFFIRTSNFIEIFHYVHNYDMICFEVLYF